MVIRITQELNAKRTKNSIVCYDLSTLVLICGSTAVSGNYKMYGVTKEEGKFVISIKTLKERHEMLKARHKKLGDTINLMSEILGDFSK